MINLHLQQINEFLNQYTTLKKLEQVTNIPKQYFVLGSVFIMFLFIFFGVGAGSLCNIIGFIYPTFMSLEAIENKVRGDDTQWLIYWVVYAFFSTIEVFTGFLLYWIPFYFAFKLAFLLWAMLPQTKGAKFLYDSFLKDFLKKNESKIDAALNDAKRSASTVASEVVAATAEVSSAALSAAAEQVSKGNENKED